ncbi:MAG: hypothetical protein WD823_13040 [Sulfuricaulis sp.]|uniref:hypothetical protein n=1 Tax=Sulfuricaulis sp. TaxID=2003553 RepID=UPI0034A32AB8
MKQILQLAFRRLILFFYCLIFISISACGGGGSSSPPTLHTVTISWTANPETAVNRAGGGYIVNISGQPAIDVPYVSGPLAPTTTTTSLLTGNYTVTVVAYSTLNPPGSTSGSVSAASGPITVNVP